MIYAIGEIILVVIGILIALSINNWNENNKNKTKEHVYLNKISDNLNDDIAFYKSNIAGDSLGIIKLSIIKEALSNKNETDFNKIKKHILTLMIGQEFTVNKTAFDNIVASGQIDVISNDNIVDELLLYYREVEMIKIGPDAAATAYNRSVFGPLLINFGSLEHTNEDMPKYQNNLALKNSVDWKIWLLQSKIRAYQYQIESAKRLRHLIAEENNTG